MVKSGKKTVDRGTGILRATARQWENKKHAILLLATKRSLSVWNSHELKPMTTVFYSIRDSETNNTN